MRWIDKSHSPRSLTAWRLTHEKDVNFGYRMMRQDHEVANSLMQGLLDEQGYLCAYTGRRISASSCHMEHLKPQEFCTPAETVDYRNIVACFPEPNRGQPCPYGAERKANFPQPGEEHLFVSPLDRSCEHRFRYTYNGHIRPTDETDEAAERTVTELNLDHEELQTLRRAAIQAVLAPAKKQISSEQALHLLTKWAQTPSGKLPAFHFALVQALKNHIESLRANKANPKRA